MPRIHRTRRLLTTAGAVLATATGLLAGAAPAHAGSGLYVDPDSNVARWVAANPGDGRQPAIADRIASQPASRWMATYDPGGIQADTAGYLADAGAALPVLVAYAIPNRDCGGASAGGAPDLAGYQGWVSNLAAGLGSHPVIVILEPDSLALQTCLDAGQIADREAALHQATTTIKGADPNATVYLDGGHSAWNSAAEQASRLEAAGVTDADGVYSNVSNFNPTAAETSYDQQILADIGDSSLHAVVDTSRNGNGSNGQWCDPAGRALGRDPTTSTGVDRIAAYLWVKLPGEADGCAGPAGQFDPQLAYELATNPGNGS